jgi:hypothetical protein
MDWTTKRVYEWRTTGSLLPAPTVEDGMGEERHDFGGQATRFVNVKRRSLNRGWEVQA